MRDPENPVTYNYPDIRQTHSMINGSQIIDRTARRIAIAMSFPFLEHTYFERLLDFANSPDEAYFYDQAIPPVITEAFLHTETTDDYSDTTNNKAYTDASASQPSAAGDFESTEFTAGEYANVADDDTDYCEKTAATTGHYAYHKFKIHALEYGAVDLIHKFTITWKGSGTGGISLYLWDGVNWVKCDESYTSDKHTLTFSTTKKEVAQEYWVSGYIRAIAQARTPKTATNTVSLKTYYIQTVINEDMGAEVELIDKAFLDAYGDVTAVYNVTDSASLTLSTHYTIRDDRKAVVTIGQTDGDLIRVTYNRYLKVGSAGLTANRLNSTSISSPYQQVSLSLEGLTVAE